MDMNLEPTAAAVAESERTNKATVLGRRMYVIVEPHGLG